MNAVDILKYGQQTVLQAIDGFPETAWETPGACGVWSVKDILAHLASYERVLVDILTTLTSGGSTPILNSFIELSGQFNDSEVNRRKERTIQDVLAEFNDTYTQVMSLLITLSPKRFVRAERFPGMAGSMPWMMSWSTCTMGINASTALRSRPLAIA